MSKTITKTDSADLMRAAGTARGTSAGARRLLDLLLGMVLLIGWMFSGVTASAQVPGAPPSVVLYPYFSPLPGGGNSYGYYVSWAPPASSGGSAITEYKISAKVSPTAGSGDVKAIQQGEVTTEFTGIASSATSKLIILSSLNNFNPGTPSLPFTCTVSVYARMARGMAARAVVRRFRGPIQAYSWDVVWLASRMG